MSDNHEELQGVAIIGMSGRFPAANDVDAFWQNLAQGVEAVTFFSEAELLAAGVAPELLQHPNYVRAGAYVEKPEYFDANFFGFIPREAEITDPQHRLFLECAWEALEQAGYDPQQVDGQIGVFGGAGRNTYLDHLKAHPEIVDLVGLYQAGISNQADFLATRVSYKLNLQGPSLTVQTACSTSLVAVHLACQSLLTYECDMALAGGVSVRPVEQMQGYLYQEGAIFSPDGHCRAFDDQAHGTVVGNGVGMVVLKRLEDAVADRDTIYAAIKGSAINNDGSDKAGYTAPSVDHQARVIRDAMALADVEPDTISYVETHGTGTTLGDPIEILGLTDAYRSSTDATQFCAIGSVKTNVGHLDAAAGVTGLIKTALALKNEQIPPSLNFTSPNRKIDLANSPFYVNTELTAWTSNGEPRRAGVSSFGIGGTNAHVVLEEAPMLDDEEAGEEREWKLLVLSAKTETALEAATDRLADWLEQKDALRLADAAYTLHVGRRAFEQRRVLVCRDKKEAVATLRARDVKRVLTAKQEVLARGVSFLFSGTGSQYVNMAKELYDTEPTFREQVDRCSEFLQPQLGFDLREVIYPTEDMLEKSRQDLYRTDHAQPAIFVIEYALSQLLKEWGVEPQAMIGHSLGEYVAASLAGVFTLEQALMLVAKRAQLIQSLPQGAMLSVTLPEAEAKAYLHDDLSLAAVNGPQQCVLSGTFEAVEQAEALLREKGVACARVHTTHAFHSAMFDPILDEFAQIVRSFDPQEPQVPFVSNVTGTWITATQATDPKYWATHLRQTVRFADGVRELGQTQDNVLLEVGPGKTLSSFALQAKLEGTVVLPSIRHIQDQTSDVAFLLEMLGKLWLAGVEVDWQAFYAKENRRRVPLPTYPFDKQRYWLEPRGAAVTSAGALVQATAIEKSSNPQNWFSASIWKQSASVSNLRSDHLLRDKRTWLVFVEQAGYGQELAQGLKQQGQEVIVVLSGVEFSQPETGVYELHPQAPEQYAMLFRELKAAGQQVQAVLYGWSLSEASAKVMAEASGLSGMLHLAQALDEQLADQAADQAERVELVVLSERLFQVDSRDEVEAEKAVLLGASLVLPHESAHLTCRVLDVGQPRANTKLLLGELLATETVPATERLVVYRGRKRYVRAFETLPMSDSGMGTSLLREKGVYLLAAGFGERSVQIAAHLAATKQAKLIVPTLADLPPEAEWQSWLDSHAEHDPLVQQIRHVQHWQALGAEVFVVLADLTDADQVREVIAKAQARFGALHGVVHAAESASQSAQTALAHLTAAECDRYLHANAATLLALASALDGQALDFCLFLSPLILRFGGQGLLARTAAQAQLEAFVQVQNETSDFPWLSVTVDESAWAQSASVFDLLFALGVAGEVSVSPQDLSAWRPIPVSTANGEEAERSVAAQASTGYARPAHLLTPYVEPENETEALIAQFVGELLGMEQVGIHDNFFDLGGNSLLATRLLSRLSDAFAVELPMSVLFEANSVAELAATIEEILIQEILAVETGGES